MFDNFWLPELGGVQLRHWNLYDWTIDLQGGSVDVSFRIKMQYFNWLLWKIV